MKKGKEKLKILIAFIIGVLVTSSVVYAATLYAATEVSYDNNNSGTTKTDVQGAIDELYELSKTHCPDGCVCQKIPTGAELLISKANGVDATYSDTTKGEMFAFSHASTAQTPATTDYRYIGSNPNNYITFNNETWRIIGVFDGRIKIIRDERINSSYWDYKQDQVGSSWSKYGSNDWSDSQLMYMLNPTTYTLKSGYSLDGNYIKDTDGNIIYRIGCRPASITSGATSYSCATNTWSLNSTALSQIDMATYYLGGPTSLSVRTIEGLYTAERSSNVPTGRPSSWIGQVGLMYPSDYGYTFAKGVDDYCPYDLYGCNYGNPSASWLYKSSYDQWTILPYPGEMMKVFFVVASGYVNIYWPNYSRGIRPVAYLKPEIALKGSGTEADPYGII